MVSSKTLQSKNIGDLTKQKPIEMNVQLNGKIGKGKAFNGCSDNIILFYADGTHKHLDGTLTNQKDARKKCMTNESGGSNTREKLNEAINLALNFFDRY